MKTFYDAPFAGQLTAPELRTLNAGGFSQTTSEQFNQNKLEEDAAEHERSTSRFHPDKQIKEFLSSKKKKFASVNPIPRKTSKRKGKPGNPPALYLDPRDRNPSYNSYGKGKGKGKPPKGSYRDSHMGSPHWEPYGKGKGKYSKGKPAVKCKYGKGKPPKPPGKGKPLRKGDKGKNPPLRAMLSWRQRASPVIR